MHTVYSRVECTVYLVRTLSQSQQSRSRSDPITRSINFDSSITAPNGRSTIIRKPFLAAISAETQPHPDPVIDFYFWLRPRFYPPETPVSIPVSIAQSLRRRSRTAISLFLRFFLSLFLSFLSFLFLPLEQICRSIRLTRSRIWQ